MRLLCRAPALAVLAGVLVLAACAPDEPELEAPDDPPETVEPDPVPPEPDDPSDPPEPDDPPDPDEPEEPDPDPPPDLSVAVTLTEVARLGSPIAGDVGPDGTLYLAEREGTVHALVGGQLGPAVVDVTAETRAVGEEGLLGIAFAPDGSELFVSYTTVIPRESMVVAYPVQDGEVVGTQRRTVFTLPQPEHNHNGGDIKVGPDGMLYIGLGDGGGAGDPFEAGQDLTTLLGALLRIDPLGGDPYAVPADNPFLDDADARDEIWAYGLRNPWRFSFDRETGDLWLADVGQNTREEVNWVPAGTGGGVNFGWNLMEGSLEFAGPEPEDHWPPVYEYDTRGPEGCSITGGFVYRGDAIPELRGAYLYSDYCVGSVRALALEDGEVVEQADLGVDGGAVVSFVEDADGELYVLDLGGSVWRLDPA